MPTIRVNTSRLGEFGSDIQTVYRKVNSILEDFNSISSNLDWDIKAESSIDSKLRTISRELEAEVRGIREMVAFFDSAKGLYDATEQYISSKKLRDEVSGSGPGELGTISSPNHGGGGISIDNGSHNPKTNWAEMGLEMLGEIGIGGATLKGIHSLGSSLISGDEFEAGKGCVGLFKDATSILGDLVKAHYDEDGINVKTLWGDWNKTIGMELFENADDLTEVTKGQLFTESFKNSAKDFLFKSADEVAENADEVVKNTSVVGENIKVGTKWAGVAFSGITNFISNKKEQKENPEMSTGRMWSETVLETGIDIALGAAGTAVAAAALGASAPAVLVCAGGAAVVWALNACTEEITTIICGEANKKNFVELTSDLVLDAATSIGKGIGNAVKCGVDVVTKWGDSLIGG